MDAIKEALRNIRRGKRGPGDPDMHASRYEGEDVYGEHRDRQAHPSVQITIQDGARNTGPLGDDEDPPEDADELDER